MQLGERVFDVRPDASEALMEPSELALERVQRCHDGERVVQGVDDGERGVQGV